MDDDSTFGNGAGLGREDENDTGSFVATVGVAIGEEDEGACILEAFTVDGVTVE